MLGQPSTEWVGRDIGAEIKNKGYAVSYFSDFDKTPEADRILIIKLLPNLNWVKTALEKGRLLFYIPVDHFEHYDEVVRDHIVLKSFSKILVHNNHLTKWLPKSCIKNVRSIDHYLKYDVFYERRNHWRDQAEKRSQFLLWVGHLEYLPTLISLLKNHPPPIDVRLLTDLEKLPIYRDKIKNELRSIGLSFQAKATTKGTMDICGFAFEQWSEEKQKKYLVTCLAAFDVKRSAFGHMTKPPTKAQKYVYNGIPFLASKNIYAFDHFKSLGLDLAVLPNWELGLREDYQATILEFAEKERWRVSLKRVALNYLEAIEDDPPPQLRINGTARTLNTIYINFALVLKIARKLRGLLRQP
jgi:hypothetical protein